MIDTQSQKKTIYFIKQHYYYLFFVIDFGIVVIGWNRIFVSVITVDRFLTFYISLNYFQTNFFSLLSSLLSKMFIFYFFFD